MRAASLTIVALLAAACGGRTTAFDGDSNGSADNPPNDSDASHAAGTVTGSTDGGLQAANNGAEGVPDPRAAAACRHYYAAQYSRCGGPTLPSSEQARVRARFVQVCLNQMMLPGSGMTADSVEACASALDASAFELTPAWLTQFVRDLAAAAGC